jgi:hypothetical protein
MIIKKLIVFMCVAYIAIPTMGLCAQDNGITPDGFSYITASGGKAITIVKYTGPKTAVLVIPTSINGVPVTIINSGAAKDIGLLEVVLPEGLQWIGWSAFEGNAITSLRIPKSLKMLDGFAGNPIETLEIPDSLEQIGGNAFSGCRITKLVVPTGLKTIGQRAFQDNKIESLSFTPGSLVDIGLEAFAGNPLKEIIVTGNDVFKKLFEPGGGGFGQGIPGSFFAYYSLQGLKEGKYTERGGVWYLEGVVRLPPSTTLLMGKNVNFLAIDGQDPGRYEIGPRGGTKYLLKPGYHYVSVNYASGNKRSESALTVEFTAKEGQTWRIDPVVNGNKVRFNLVRRN